MKGFEKNKRDADDCIRTFCTMQQEELLNKKKEDPDYAPLREYDKNLFDSNDQLLPLGITGYIANMRPVVTEILQSQRSLRILDAGCGYGTESLLFSLLGCDVSGVELIPEMVSVAERRIPFFQRQCDFNLNINFLAKNIFSFLESGDSFDIIWAMQAVSHIFPPQRFLALAYEKLKNRGKLIISDPNSLNPTALYRSIKTRGSILHSPHNKYRDPESGHIVEFGQEYIFSVIRMKKKLIQTGFKIKEIDMIGFMGSTVLSKGLLKKEYANTMLSYTQKVLKRIPIIKLFGSIYTIVAEKE